MVRIKDVPEDDKVRMVFKAGAILMPGQWRMAVEKVPLVKCPECERAILFAAKRPDLPSPIACQCGWGATVQLDGWDK